MGSLWIAAMEVPSSAVAANKSPHFMMGELDLRVDAINYLWSLDKKRLKSKVDTDKD